MISINPAIEVDPLIQEIQELNQELDEYFADKFKPCASLSRKIVSFQANKKRAEYRWFKYKEAFSADLVEYFLEQYSECKEGKILDPFAGAGTALFACSESSVEADGIELLPIGQEIIAVRQILRDEFSDEDYERLVFWKDNKPWKNSEKLKKINYLKITSSAYPEDTEASIEKYLAEIEKEIPKVRRVLRFALLCVLESVSYTRKDGQYLRWDKRADRKYGSKKFDKGRIYGFEGAISEKIGEILDDTFHYVETNLLKLNSEKKPIHLYGGSCLEILPTLRKEGYSGIFTSPPYCNRYDYTRTYALELALLGLGEQEMIGLRQAMVSCTVENKEKQIIQDWKQAVTATDNQKLLQAILTFLNRELERKNLNNNGIPRMVRGYFYEMACVIAECCRVLKTGAPLFMVNDNVRYAGIEIPVDTILSNIAEAIGFRVEAILVLPTGKGNSSQQMGVHGRTELRKCVYVWRKVG